MSVRVLEVQEGVTSVKVGGWVRGERGESKGGVLTVIKT